ncbi:hypothetical protein KJ708_05680 [bacterium]|nr:hypothetical protein [bacterium]MBU1917361.1 hypothetical protein [bacterium]
MKNIFIFILTLLFLISCGSSSSTPPVDDTPDPPADDDTVITADDITETTVSFDLDGYEFDEPVMTYYIEDTEENELSIYITDETITCSDLVPDKAVNIINLVLQNDEAFGMSVSSVNSLGATTKISVNNNADITILSNESGEIKGTFEATSANGDVNGQFVAEECP